MAPTLRCPACGDADLSAAEGGRLRCPKCRKEFVHRTAWLPYLLTWAAVGAVVAVGSVALFKAIGQERGTIVWWIVFGAVTGVVATLLARRFRRLEQTRAAG